MSFALKSCPFALGYNRPGLCFCCAGPLSGRRTRWCSPECCRAYYQNHDWNEARELRLARDRRRCIKCGQTTGLQVNHIAPRYGRGYHRGCWNHQENLETLCKRCHEAVTARQRRERPEEVRIIVWAAAHAPLDRKRWAENPYLAPRLRRKAHVHATLADALAEVSRYETFASSRNGWGWLFAPFEVSEADIEAGASLVERKRPMLGWSDAFEWVRAAQYVGPKLANALGDVRAMPDRPEESEASA